jgi:hypothetical protein
LDPILEDGSWNKVEAAEVAKVLLYGQIPVYILRRLKDHSYALGDLTPVTNGIVAINKHLTLIREYSTRDDLDQGGLAGPVWAQEAKYLTPPYLERNPVKSPNEPAR